MKKLAFFLFAAASALSASLATAAVDCEQCYVENEYCRDIGVNPPNSCARQLRDCLRRCTP